MANETRVVEGEELTYLLHRGTIHGAQYRDERRRMLPVPYYLSPGPIDAVFEYTRRQVSSQRWGVLGLGTGAIAARTRPDESVVFYENDPHVAELAGADFDYLERASADVDVRVEDGRDGVADSDGDFGLLVVDAFVGDAFPVRLATREALATYAKATSAAAGVLINVSVSCVAVEQLVAVTGRAAGWTVWYARHRPELPRPEDAGDTPFWSETEWVFLLKTQRSSRHFAEQHGGWRELEPEQESDASYPVLTDERARKLERLR